MGHGSPGGDAKGAATAAAAASAAAVLLVWERFTPLSVLPIVASYLWCVCVIFVSFRTFKHGGVTEGPLILSEATCGMLAQSWA